MSRSDQRKWRSICEQIVSIEAVTNCHRGRLFQLRTLVEMEATHRSTRRQTAEALDGEHQGGRRIQRIHTERDRTISSVPGQKRVEKLRH